jgi:Rieske 2Fe-2S protein
MSVVKSAADVARSLERHKLVFREIDVASEGIWSPEDADWNYKDIPHLNEVHALAETVPALIGDDLICTVNIQKMFGIPMPIALVNYVTADGTQVYYTTLLFFVLLVETRIVPLPAGDGEPCRTRAETKYRVGGPRLLQWLFPIVRRTLLANYKVLMSEDLPMRERRGQLRGAGYSFVSDGRARTFAETTDLTVSNVIPPPVSDAEVTADLSPLNTPGSSVLLGRGPGGLRLVRGETAEILVYDRVCSHEGACLDEARLAGQVVVCPWHAKRVKPLATFAAGLSDLQSVDLGDGRSLEVSGTTLRAVGLT